MTPEQWTEAQNKLVGAARDALRRFWRTLDLSDPVAARKRLEAFWPTLVNDYGEVAATLAADHFEEVTGLRAILAEGVNADQVNARMRWAMTPLFEHTDAGAALGLLAGLVDELVKQPGRDTYMQSADRNGLRFARIPTGAETCSFCLMLASRGFAYLSEHSASFVGASTKKFHGDCDCRVAVEGEDVGSYDPEALYDQYNEAAWQAVGEGSRTGRAATSAILSAMRKQLDLSR